MEKRGIPSFITPFFTFHKLEKVVIAALVPPTHTRPNRSLFSSPTYSAQALLLIMCNHHSIRLILLVDVGLPTWYSSLLPSGLLSVASSFPYGWT